MYKRQVPDSGTAGRLDLMGLVRDPMRLTTRAVGIPLMSAIYGGGPSMAATTGLLGSVRPMARGMSPMIAAEGAQRIEDPMSSLLGPSYP